MRDIDRYRTDISSHMKAMKVDVDICKDSAICPHTYLNKWDGIYVCTDCYYKLNDTLAVAEMNKERIRKEEELESCTPLDPIPSYFHSDSDISDFMGKNSACRGVKLGFLLAFTLELSCWDWTAAALIRRLIKPNTNKTRVRFTELDWMEPYVGQAQTFLSYAQQGKWGDVVAALLDGNADLDRIVWIDIFAYVKTSIAQNN